MVFVVAIAVPMVAVLGFLLYRSFWFYQLAVIYFVILCFNHGLFERYLDGYISGIMRSTQNGVYLALLVAAFLRVRGRFPSGSKILAAIVIGILVSTVITSSSLTFAGMGIRLTGLYFLSPVVGRPLAGFQSWLVRVVAISSVPTLALGLRQALGGLWASETFQISTAKATYQVGEQIRLLGAASSGQEFSYSLVLLTAVGSVMVVKREHGRKYWVPFLVVVIGLQFLSLQRSALVASLAVGLATYVWYIPGRRLHTAIMAVLMLPVVGMFCITALSIAGERSDAAVARALSIVTFSSDSAVSERLDEVWPEVISYIGARPAFGWGPGSAGSPSVDRVEDAPLGPLITDNMYLHLAVQYGVLTAALVIVWILALIRAACTQHTDEVAARVGAVGLVGLLVAGTVGSYISILDVTAPILIMAGTASLSKNRNRNKLTQLSDSGLIISRGQASA